MQIYKAVESPEIRVLMSVPKKKLRHAVDRNRVKRLLRETYRLNKHILLEQAVTQGVSVRMAFIWIPTEVVDYKQIEKKMKEALTKAGRFILEQTTDKLSIQK